jgi:hypothetical protein
LLADELLRQADFFIDIVELLTNIGLHPAERTPREGRPPREDRAASHTPQFLQRPASPQRAGAPVGADEDDDSYQ